MCHCFLFVTLQLLSLLSWAKVDHVIIVSVDGGKADLLLKANMPDLKGIVASGASTFTAKTIQPSITLPSHTSMLTGVSPKVHKITWNSWEPSKGLVAVPTVFSLVKDDGLKTAFFAAKEKFKHLETSNTFHNFTISDVLAKDLSKQAVDYFDQELPDLLFVHLPDLDIAGHLFGWDSKAQKKATKEIDLAIGRIKKALMNLAVGKSYVMIITSDHGGTKKGHNGSTASNENIPWIAWGNVIGSDSLELENIRTIDTTPTVLRLLDVKVPDEMEGIPISKIL